MSVEYLTEVLKGVAIFFIHPLTYLGLLLLFIMGLSRVKRERRDFHVRIYDFIDDFLISFWPGLLTGLILSAIILGVGFVLPIEWVAIIGLVYAVLALTFQVRLLSPAYIGSLSIGVGFVLSKFDIVLPYFGTKLSQFGALPYVQIACIFSLLMFAEGILIRKNGAKKTAPRLLSSKRGKYVGAHETKRVWLIPLFLFLPAGQIPGFGIWPLFGGDELGFFPVVVPFFIGFHQLIKGSAPVESLRRSGSQVIALSLVVGALAVISYWFPILLPAFVAVSLLGREAIWTINRIKDDHKPSFFTSHEKGLMVLATIPGSTAEKLGLKIGELIMKVNGIEVSQPHDFYLALQKNSAYCKLEVIDKNGEIRFAQGALYDGEHHQIGVILIKEDYELQNSVI